MIVVGITGSLATGKSTLASFLREKGFPVYSSDAVIHSLYERDAFPEIKKTFPSVILSPSRVSRKKLGEIVFREKGALEQLEKILHPLEEKAQEIFLKEQKKIGKKISFLEIPLLFETKSDRRCDAVLSLFAEEGIRRSRAFSRVGMTEGHYFFAKERMILEEDRIRRSHYNIDTSSHLEKTKSQLELFLRSFLWL